MLHRSVRAETFGTSLIGLLVLLAPSEMAVHSTPSSSDKPGHDPPERRLSAEPVATSSASRSRRYGIMQSGQVHPGESGRLAFLTEAIPHTAPTWLEDISTFPNAQRVQFTEFAGLDGKRLVVCF